MVHNTRFPSEQHIGTRNKRVFHNPNTHAIEGISNYKTAVRASILEWEKAINQVMKQPLAVPFIMERHYL